MVEPHIQSKILVKIVKCEASNSRQADADTVFLYSRLPRVLQEYDDRASSPSGEGVSCHKVKTTVKFAMCNIVKVS